MTDVYEKSQIVTLECGNTGDPAPNVTWFYNGQSVSEVCGVNIMTASSMLQIPPNYCNSGLYQCVVSNGNEKLLGSVHTIFFLNVTARPPQGKSSVINFYQKAE